MLIVSLLAAIMLTSCAPAATAAPTTITSTSTPIPIPMNTNSIIPSSIPETQTGTLIEKYQNVTGQDLRQYGALGEELITTLWFDDATIWSDQDIPIAKNILGLGMNPGLGIRDLHAEGITGKGVTVAIIDQPVILDHPEFQGKIIKYFDVGTGEFADRGSMHGPAVTSLLVGDNIGTAPDARVYFVAAPSWLEDAQYYADALNWIIDENEKLPEGQKIRAVSVSTMPTGIWALLHKNHGAWEAAYQRATEAGILVLDCTYEEGITVSCTHDLNDPDNVTKCIPNWTGPTDSPHRRINIPTSRTTATERDGSFSYQFTGLGGLSWTVPYLTGVFAMAWQINPKLPGPQLVEMLYATSYRNKDGQYIIDPKAFIRMVKHTVDE